MNKIITFFFLSLSLFLLFSIDAKATHNRAGEILVEMIRDADGNCTNTVKITIKTYTKTSATEADRDSLTVSWGDGDSEVVLRMNGNGQPLENDIKFNIYMATHTFDGPGRYIIGFVDPNRNAGVLNVNFPNSVSIPFYLENIFTVTGVLAGCNSSPVLSVPPIDIACTGEVFTHNPGANDPDGDSLSYQLITPLMGPNTPVPNFIPPAGMTMDPITGSIVWPSPNEAGEYNIAFQIVSYRNGFPLDTMIRDMQVIVEDCENDPPRIVSLDEICVIAGTSIDFDITATAPITDINQQVRLLAYGAPFNFSDENSPATLTPPSTAYSNDPLVKIFHWDTNCEHISNQTYNVVLRAVDDFLGDTLGLAFLKTVRIKVMGPPPEEVLAEPTNESILVNWKLPYLCEDASNVSMRGFTVWRRINSDQTPLDTCIAGLGGRGYTKLTTNPIFDQENGRYFYLDNNVEKGRTYCYRVVANFAHPTAAPGIFFNLFEGLASDEVCVQLGRDVPLLVKVDVTQTATTDGQIQVCWTKPVPEDLDTILNAPPYTYELLRADGHNEDPTAFIPIDSKTFNSFATANDTCFLDIGLNTVAMPYTYKVNFYVNNGEELGSSTLGGSVFLNATPTDRVNILTWDEFVPWENYAYSIYRENTSGGLDSITTISEPIYRDEGLVNGQEYCYFVRTQGTYNIDGIASPLINNSQRLCSTPVDNVPPCPPELSVSNLCDQGLDCESVADLENILSWIKPVTFCPEFEDVAGYNLYYSPQENGDFTLISNIENPDILDFIHQPESGLAGCYATTAIDTIGNESIFSNIVCVDNCPFYEIPNAFTPNADNQNDVFVPTRSCFIASVNFQVYNKWGGLVFETNDPALNWDGTNSKGEKLTAATYFYRCEVFENRVEGIVPAPELLNGYIELLREAN